MTAWAIAKVLVATVLVTSGAAKLGDLPAFATLIRTMVGSLGDRASNLFAAAIALAELLIGVSSLLLYEVGAFDVLACCLLGVLLLVTILGTARYPELRCQCFGSLNDARFGRGTVLRDLVLFSVASAVVAAPPRAEPAGAAWYSLGPVALGLGIAVFLAAQAAATLRVAQSADSLRPEGGPR